jgi:hypothetical protein
MFGFQTITLSFIRGPTFILQRRPDLSRAERMLTLKTFPNSFLEVTKEEKNGRNK